MPLTKGHLEKRLLSFQKKCLVIWTSFHNCSYILDDILKRLYIGHFWNIYSSQKLDFVRYGALWTYALSVCKNLGLSTNVLFLTRSRIIAQLLDLEKLGRFELSGQSDLIQLVGLWKTIFVLQEALRFTPCSEMFCILVIKIHGSVISFS